ncbi:transmembrane protein 120 homolog isoform X2 [Anabrus simplex]
MNKLHVMSQDYDVEDAVRLKKKIRDRKEQLSEMEQGLPKQSGLYLSVILGSVNVSMLNTNDKFRYKNEYEKFKLVLSIICLLLATANIFASVRILELALMFLLVWFYSTLTIRESILKVNGSRIKGWWRAHHFISAIAAAVLLIWPTTKPWYEFRTQFMIFCAYISVVQSLQFWYQRGVLYRLKALGERHDMDITIEGFHSWMWKGLSFLVPFLYFGYAFQAYNFYVLYRLSFMTEATWQVPALAFLFALLFAGNLITTSFVITQKLNTDFLQNLYLIPWVTRARSFAQMSDSTKDLTDTRREVTKSTDCHGDGKNIELTRPLSEQKEVKKLN